MIAINPDIFPKGILRVCNTDLSSAFLKYTLIQTLAYVCLIGGILVFSRRDKIGFTKSININVKRLIIFTLAACLAVFGTYVYFLINIGGLQYLISHLHQRINLQAGRYYLEFLELMPLIVVCLLLLIHKKKSNYLKVLLVAALVLFSFIYTSFGGRKPTLILLGVTLVGWHYYIKTIGFNIRNFVFAIGALACFAFYMLLVPQLRVDKSRLKYINTEWYSAERLIKNVSYVYIEVLCANYYNADNAWYMDGYFAPVKAFGYRGDKGNIPQVDQGVYLKSIYEYQKDFRPPMPRNKVSLKSWPTENFGFAYANFLWPGIIVFFLLQGMFFGAVYNFTCKHLFNPVCLLFYVQVILKFNFSSLSIAFFIKSTVLYFVCWFVYRKYVQVPSQQATL